MMENFSQKEFNDFVLDNNIYGFFNEDLTLVSGRKTRFYANWRNILENVWLTDKLADFVISFVRSIGLEPDCFFGVPEGATKIGIITQYKWAKESGDPSSECNILAMGRGKPKEHGEAKDRFFIGMPRGRVVVIEDVTTTGGSLMKTLKSLKEAGVEVIAALSLTNRMEKTDEGISVKEAVERLGIRFCNMSSALELLPVIYERLNPGEEIGRKIEEEFREYGIGELTLNNETIIDKLLDKIDEKQTPCIVGLDPQIRFIPPQIKNHCLEKYGNNHKAVAESYIEFNRAIIDATYDLVPAFKLNMCFYEKYGSEGVRAFQETTSYVRSKGCVVIEDAKRNEVSESAKAYAEGHLGEVDMCDDSKAKSLDVDIVVVNPYLGSDGINPFIDVCKKHQRGIFILVKTSNPSSGELQDKFIKISEEEKYKLKQLGIEINDKTQLYNLVALQVNKYAQGFKGKRGYSPIGAVVGATYPSQAETLRKIMPNSFFLVPGYGAQGGGADDVVPCFNSDGYGAIINSSRGIIYAYQKYGNPEKFAEAAREATKLMIKDINSSLERSGKFPKKWRKETI